MGYIYLLAIIINSLARLMNLTRARVNASEVPRELFQDHLGVCETYRDPPLRRSGQGAAVIESSIFKLPSDGDPRWYAVNNLYSD